MSDEAEGILLGASRFVQIAGAIAEAAVRDLMLISPGGSPRVLAPLETDLPGLIAAAEPGSLLASADGSIGVLIEPNSLRWSTSRMELAQLLHSAQSA